MTHSQAYVRIVIFLKIGIISGILYLSGVSFADEKTWRERYNTICGQNHDAAAMPRDELLDRINQCDSQLERIRASDHPRKKIYLFRFEKCRDLYQYIADSIQERRIEE